MDLSLIENQIINNAVRGGTFHQKKVGNQIKFVISDVKSAKRLILILAYYILEKEIHKGKFQIQYKKNDSARFIFTINAWP